VNAAACHAMAHADAFGRAVRAKAQGAACATAFMDDCLRLGVW
jgi:hypothetical protein